MNYAAVLDVSSIVWDPEDYNTETEHYYNLKEEIINFINKVEKESPSILMRAELLSQVIEGFPYNQMPDSFYDFGGVVYAFLARIGSDIIVYDADVLEDLIADPNMIKEHFNNTIKEEINYLMAYMHRTNDNTSVYFTFQYLWGENDPLKTLSLTEGEKVYETIISDRGDALEKFFSQFKKVFEHNPKHHIGNKQGDYVSPLSCFDGKDNTRPQQLLNEARMHGKKFYCFDDANDTYVVFIKTEGNIYHGHDEVDINKIPPPIRRELNKEQ